VAMASEIIKQHDLSFQAHCSSLLQRRKALSGFTFVYLWQKEIKNHFKTSCIRFYRALSFQLPWTV